MADPITYTCAECEGVFEADWTDEEAREEAALLFPGHDPEDMEVVCDDCWKAIMKRIAS